MARKKKVQEQAPGEGSGSRQVQVRLVREAPFRPLAVSYVALSRLGDEIQLDLGALDLQEVVRHLNSEPGSAEPIPVETLFTGYLTTGAFLKLHHDVNQFFDAFMREAEGTSDAQ